MIDLFSPVFRMGKLASQFTVICKKQDSSCRVVETSDRINPLASCSLNEVKHCFVGMRILNSGNIILRFIKKDIDLFLR